MEVHEEHPISILRCTNKEPCSPASVAVRLTTISPSCLKVTKGEANDGEKTLRCETFAHSEAVWICFVFANLHGMF